MSKKSVVPSSKVNSNNTSNININSNTWEGRIQATSIITGLSIEQVENALKTLGVEKDTPIMSGIEMLANEEYTPFGDIRKIFCDDLNIPIAKVRVAMKYLRGPELNSKKENYEIDPELTILKTKYGVKLQLDHIETEELLQYYNPSKANSPITQILRKRYGEQSVIAFKPDTREIAIEETIDYINDLEMGYREEDSIEVNGSLVRLYPIGVLPDQMLEEDPFFEGEPLRRGRSTRNRFNWNDIPMEIRQFCRLIKEKNAIDIEDRIILRELYSTIKQGIKELKKLYPEIDLEFRERAKKNQLPTLMIPIDDISSRKQNPFGMNRTF